MKTVRSIARWSSLPAMIVGAAASAGVSTLIASMQQRQRNRREKADPR